MSLYCTDIMTSSGQKKGGCGKIMASFGTHIKCAPYSDKGSKNDHCVLEKEDCPAYLLLTPEQHQQLFES